MATKGNTSVNKGIPKLKDAFVVIIKTEWNAAIVNKLEAGVKKVCKENNVTSKTFIVPGAFEIPAVSRRLAQSAKYDAVLCLGCVIRGATPHFEYIAARCAGGIAQVAADTGVPTIFGVLTTDTVEQAMERAGIKAGNKGFDTAMAAMEMADLIRKTNP